MLPAYLSLYVYSNSEDNDITTSKKIRNSLNIILFVGVGFVALFSLSAVIVSLSSELIGDLIPFLSILLSMLILYFGIGELKGEQIFSSKISSLSSKIGNPKNTNPIGFILFGVSYGLASVGCALPIFISVVTKSITRLPREGNPPPRIVETSSGMLNSIGLANIGVEEYINKMIPKYNNMDIPIIMNIAGSSEEEYCEVMDLVESVSSNIVGYEINISCPNVKVGGMEFGVDCELTEKLTSQLRKRTERLLIMKLSPNVTDISAIAQSAANGGADAVSAINTLVGMSINIQSMKSNIHYGFAGLSGPAIKPVGIASVYKIHQSVKIPIIGIGGIKSSDDVLEYMLAGAFAVEIGTANYRDPNVGNNIISDINNFLDENNIKSINQIIGKVKLGK